MELAYVDVEITKFDQQADGTVIVRGAATTDDIDSDRQIIDSDFAARKLPEWLKSGGNVRAMHKPEAIGGGMMLEREGNAQILTAHIIDPTACKLATPHPVTGVRVLRAFSVGISGAKIIKDAKAPGGRIVDGEFVEVSLVDRPANSSCKVDLVSKMADGSAHFTDILVKADDDTREDCPTCKGTGKIMDGNRDCPDCEDGKMPMEKVFQLNAQRAVEGAVYKKDYSTEERKEMADKGHALPDGSYPIGDSEDLHNAYTLAASGHGDVDGAKKLIGRRAKELGVANPFDKDDDKSSTATITKDGKIPPADQAVTSALDAAQAAQAEDNEHHMSGDDEDDDDAEKFEAPYLVKRLHDHLCAAFTPDAVKAAYPTVQNFGDVVDPNYWAQRVTEIIGQDGGTGEFARKVSKASTMYGLVVQLNHADSDIVEQARQDLAKAFADSYPSIHLSPGDIMPGQFKRPYLSSGRANETAKPGQKPRLPMQASVPDASQFERHYLTDGRAAPSPMQGAPNTASMGKIDKLDCSREEVEVEGTTIVKMVHTPTGVGAQGATSKDAWKNLKDAVKQRQFYTNNAKDTMMQTIEQVHDLLAGMHPDMCAMKPKDSTEEMAEPDDAGTKVVDNEAHAAPKDADMASAAKFVTADGVEVQKLIDGVVSKLTKKFKKKERKLTEKLQTVEAERARLAEMADPEAGAYRGGRGVLPSIPKSADETAQGTEDPAAIEKREKVEWLLDTMQTTTDQGTKRQALEKLEELVSGDELAALLVKTR